METTDSFKLGRIYLTPGACLVLQGAGQNPAEFLRRHALCDWGEVSSEDWRANGAAVNSGARVLSVYVTRTRDRIWIITEADRRSTTLLTPNEY